MAKGEPTICLTRELGLAHQQFPSLRRRNTKWTGHGTSANNHPPIIRVISRETGEQPVWVCDYAHTRTCTALIAEHLPTGSTQLSTDEG